jgi:alcohol dehydrogenase
VLDREYPLPVPAVNESLVRVRIAGICSTDLELVKGYYGFRGVLGHEFVGVVEQSSQPSWIGQRVVCSINFADMNSPEYAEFGLEHHPHRTVLGIVARDGAMADYVAIPDQNLLQVPDNISDETAVFAEPVAAALRIAEQITLRPSQAVAVIGPGRLGMLVAQVMALRGTQVTMIGRSDRTLELARQLGMNIAKTERLHDSCFDIVVDCTGSPAGLEQSIRLTKPRGTLVLKSTYEGMASINLTKVVVDEINIVGSRCGPMAAALRLLSRGQIEVSSLIDARFNADQTIEAFRLAAQPGIRKVLLDFQ